MARQPRVAPAGYVYHVMNRADGRTVLFRTDKDIEAFEQVLVQVAQEESLQILGYCLLPRQWHFVVRQTREGQLSNFFRRLTLMHALRWRSTHRNAAPGGVYRGRFKSFPIQPAQPFREVMRYVEGKAACEGETKRAQDWRGSSLWARQSGPKELKAVFSDWPGGIPAGWTRFVNQPIPELERMRLETCEFRGRPYGEDAWVKRTVAKLGLQHTVRPQGRPRKVQAN